MSENGIMYDLVLLGATGYTGKYTVEHISTHLPTDLKWAVAGRSTAKLTTLVDEIRPLNPDRLSPKIEVATLSGEDLDCLAKKTRLLINTIGPYCLYSSPILEACARNGTHYLDATGESPWVLDMIRKHHDKAKSTKAIIIPEIGIESAPSDLLTFALVSMIRAELSVGTRKVITSLHEMNSRPSGGTLATLLAIFDVYTLGQLTESFKPWVMSPVPHSESAKATPWIEKLSGTRSVPDLGTLATSYMATPNTAIVQRSWGLFDQGNFYGQNFQYNEFMRVRNMLIGVASHLVITLGGILLCLSPIRWLTRKLVFKPGQGPDKQDARQNHIEIRAVATSDSPDSQRAFAKLSWNGSLYHLTGVLLAEAAIVILRERTAAHDLGGGCLTPATLGYPLIDRLQKAGVKFETKLLGR